MNEDLKKEYFDRLKEWEDELVTNEHGLAGIAEKVISLTKSDMEEFWPEILTERKKEDEQR